MSIFDIFNITVLIAIGCYLIWRGLSPKWKEYDVKVAKIHRETFGSWPVFSLASKWNILFVTSPLRTKFYIFGGLIGIFGGILYFFISLLK